MIDSGFFVPEANQIHPSWYQEWGKSIGSASLADELFNNTRLRNRVYEQIIHTGQVQVDARFTSNELACLKAYAADKSKLERICGLVVYGKTLRENIAKVEFDQLTKQLTLDEMKIAVGLRDFHVEDLEYSIDMSRLKELVERTGASCVTMWRNELPPQMKLRVDFLEEPDHWGDFDNTIVSADQAAFIVEAVAQSITSEFPRLAA